MPYLTPKLWPSDRIRNYIGGFGHFGRFSPEYVENADKFYIELDGGSFRREGSGRVGFGGKKPGLRRRILGLFMEIVDGPACVMCQGRREKDRECGPKPGVFPGGRDRDRSEGKRTGARFRKAAGVARALGLPRRGTASIPSSLRFHASKRNPETFQRLQ